MSGFKKVKTSAKVFMYKTEDIQDKVLSTMDKISAIVGSTLGPSGRVCLIESDLEGLPNKSTKDGVTVFQALGAHDPFEHAIIEQTRDAATRTASEAGDGPQPMWSKILTPKGWITMAEVKEGMEICGTNGTVQTVLGVYDKGVKEIYELEFSNGRKVQCSPDHLWTVFSKSGHKGGSIKTLTASHLIKDFRYTDPKGNIKSKYFVPTTMVDYGNKDSELPLHPYLLGLLLGDGTLTDESSIELSLGVKKIKVLENLNLPEGLTYKSTFCKDKNYYRVKIQGLDKNRSTIRNLLHSLGLKNVNSETKFIPEQYLLASVEERRSLLQGLIDTDGHINKRGRFEFSTVSEQLAEDIKSLALSLNIPLYSRLHHRKENDGSYSKKSIYRISEMKGYKNGNKIYNIKATGQMTEMRCIKVSNDDHLYITDGFISTHNTTTATVLATALTRNLLNYCNKNKKMSPQRTVRIMNKLTEEVLLPYIDDRTIHIDGDNLDLIKKVATVSANGDQEMADAVISAFEMTGMTENSHVTIQQVPGPNGYQVEQIEGLPIPIGYSESIGHFQSYFINDLANQRCLLEKPMFIIFNGQINDPLSLFDLLNTISAEYISGKAEYKNVVVVATGFGEAVLNNLALNFPNTGSINVVPLLAPMNIVNGSQQNFLYDLSAFTGATVFGMNQPLDQATPEDLAIDKMERLEMYKFKTTVVGKPEELNIQSRVEILQGQLKNPESRAAEYDLKERIGKLTSGIAKLIIKAGSAGELRERHDRAEDAVCAVRAALNHGALPGGCRIMTDLSVIMARYNSENKQHNEVAREVMSLSLATPLAKLLDNAGYTSEEVGEILSTLVSDNNLVYDVEEMEFGNFMEMGVFDARKAVEEALKNAMSIASVMGVMGGIICQPRDEVLEREESRKEKEYRRVVEDPHSHVNEANERG